jgi:DNA repair protein RecN (Recombination protein N)
MLQKLHIQNYAIIEELEINFSDKLNIITGETGAGKSILMGALSLVLGERADSAVLLKKEKKAVVEASFATTNEDAVKLFLKGNELDAEDELVLRREIAPNGKSRAFINDTPVNLNQLKELSSLLVDLHQQFDTLELGSSGFQQQVLDAIAGNGKLLQQYALLYQQYSRAKASLQELKAQQDSANAALDYNQFLFDELNEAGLKENELEELEAELKLLTNAEQVKFQLANIYFELKDNEQPIVQQLKSLGNKLLALEQYHTEIAGLAKRMQSAQVELLDIAGELENIDNSVQFSAERIALVNERISIGYRLLKKHGVNNTAALLQIKDGLQQKLNDILNITEVIAQKEKLTQELFEQCGSLAADISANRKKAIDPFTVKVDILLAQVGMPNARFRISLQRLETFSGSGIDKIDFLFNANQPAGKEEKTDRFELLGKVASGGELSRLMLCVKSLVAKKLQLPTLIFDEIDTGISGEAARQVGNIMKDLSVSHQLIAITHQPQIAARATAHYFVYKSIQKDNIITSIRLLNNDERITTIAQMLSGEKPTAAALQNAREMVGN